MAIYVMIPSVGGDVKVPGYEKCFVADSFSFGVEREMKESGEKGGTADINIGVGELQECTISKSMDRASTTLAQFAINGNSCDIAEIHFVEVAGSGTDGKPYCYLKYKLDRCFVKSWSTSGDADDRPTEEVAFYYNKIAFNYASTPNGKDFDLCTAMAWDNVTNKKWEGHGVDKLTATGFA
jgi:type VI secretion system secreted protein Hcp